MGDILKILLSSMLLLGITNSVIPSIKCEKQIRFLLSIVLLSVVLGVFFDFIDKINIEIPALISSGEYPDYAEPAMSEVNNYIISGYTQSLSEDIQKTLTQKTGRSFSVKVIAEEDITSDEYGTVRNITVYGVGKEDVAKVKNIIKSFYNVDDEHIFISEKGK